MKVRSFVVIGISGALGGAINAALCYFKLPVPVGQGDSTFSVAILPAGAAHGALLAVVSVAGWQWLRARPAVVRWGGLPVLGWVSGWLSFIPISCYISAAHVGTGLFGTGLFSGGQSQPRGMSLEGLVGALTWPFKNVTGLEALAIPFSYFGLVGLVYGLLSAVAPRFGRSGREITVAIFCAAGVLGSLWWWIDWQPWYFSLIHGTLWGLLVGTGAWHADQPSRAPSR